VRDLSFKHKARMVGTRVLISPPGANQFQSGDHVLYHTGKQRDNKLSPSYAGPFEVLSHYQNDVTCRHLILHYIEKFHVSRLGMFHGSADEAAKMAMLDKDQHVVLSIDAHRGVPSRRMGMEFGVRFADGDYLWIPYSTDISTTEAFAKYCATQPELKFLLLTVKDIQIQVKLLNTTVLPPILKQEFFLDLRYFGEQFYDFFQDKVEDAYSKSYYFLAHYTDFHDSKSLKVRVSVPLRKQVIVFNGYAYALYGQVSQLPLNGTLVDAAFAALFPCVLQK
jgi:hypothetical protein